MIARIFTAPDAKQIKSPFVWRRDWGFSAVDCSPKTFLRYGICGDCEVACRDGLTKIKNLTKSHQVISRNHGFMHPVALLHNQFDTSSTEDQRRIGIRAGALGNGLPQQYIVLGAEHKVTRYIKDPESRRLSAAALDLELSEGRSEVRNCAAGELCVPLFAEPLEISIAGVYVSCPSNFRPYEKPRLS